jgi:DME family drug/metabolite transporter
MAIALALLSSLLMSFTTIIMKKGIARTNPTSAMLVVTVVGSLIFLAVSLPVFQFDYLKSKAFLLFILAGIFAPALVRWLYFISLDRLGASMSASIQSTGPAFTAILAIIFLKEKLTVSISLGIVLIITGIIILQRSIDTDGDFRVQRKKDLIFPLLSAIFLGLALVFRKMGLNILDVPLFGVTVGFLTSLVFYSILFLMSKSMRNSVSMNRNDLLFLCGAGVSLTTGWLTLFYALSLGDVIIVAPLANLQPVMVVGLSYLFLKDIEKITPKMIAGILVVLIGVLLTAFK